MRARVAPSLVSVFVLLALLVGAAPTTGQATPVGIACLEATPRATPVGQTAPFPLAVTDDLGREVTFARPPERIVSIAPSNTEILFALGLGDRVVAVDAFSDYPPEATAKPQVGDYVEPDLEQVVAATPDLVLAAGIHEGTVLPALESLGVPVVVVEPETLDEVYQGIDLIGRVAGVPEQADAVICDLSTRVAAVEATVAGASQPRVFFELSPELYTAGPGSFIDDVITRAGGQNIAADAAEMWPQMSNEAVVAADPEVILLADHEAGVTPEQVAARPGWQEVDMAVQRRIVAIDPDLVARPGPRVVDGLEEIARILHPDQFPGSGG